MRFDANRLAKLAGLSGETGTGMLTEGSTRRPRNVHEYGNRREREEYGDGGDYGDEILNELDIDDDEVIEISEAMLRSEIKRLRNFRLNESRKRQHKRQRTQRRHQKLEETMLRNEIRKEINDIFEDLQLTSKWIYGKNLPRRSSPGKITMGAPGIGFKSFGR